MMTFDPYLYLRDITLVGCGGTGSLVARAIARLLYDMKQRRLSIPHVRFIDFDVVETRNCGRQLFQPQEIGQFKSAVLARRYNLAFGLDIACITEPVNAAKHFERYRSSIVIDALDNHAARQELVQITNAVFLSCGNHHSHGQVVIGNSHDREQVLRALECEGATLSYLPTAYTLFPQLLEPEATPQPDTRSCAELAATGEQHLFINETIATVAAVYLYKLLHRQPITSFISFVGIAEMPVVRSVPISPDNLRAYL